MAQLTRPDLHAEIDGRFPDNDKQLITPPIVRAFLHNLVDSALLAVSDKLTLSTALSLAQARGLLITAPPSVQPGLDYAITGNWNGVSTSLSTVYVRGLSTRTYGLRGVLLTAGTYAEVLVDVLAGTALPATVDTYTKAESDALLAQKADLVNGLVPEAELPARAIGGIDYRTRKGANGGVIAITAGSYWHVVGNVTLDLTDLPLGEVFFLRISSFASNLVWTRLLATDGKVIGTYPQGTALLFRRNGPDPTDLAVVTVSSEYPSYAGAFVPTAIKDAVAAGSYTDNQLDATPPGSVATMQFRDAQYLYFCLLDEQITNGVLTYAWLRVPRASPAGGGGTAPDLSNYYTKAQGDARYAPKASLDAGSGRTVTFDKERHWPTITTGTYALDATGAVVDVCFQLILAVGSSELAIPASGFVKLTSTAFDATKKNIYSFLVGVDGLIQYYLKQPVS